MFNKEGEYPNEKREIRSSQTQGGDEVLIEIWGLAECTLIIRFSVKLRTWI